MQRSAKWMLALVVAALCVASALHVYAQGARPAPAPRPTAAAAAAVGAAVAVPPLGFTGLELKIEADKTEYMLGEPIVLYVSLTNTGNAPVGVLDFLEPETHYVQYLITRPGQTTAERFLPYMANCPDTGPISLGPGQTITGTAKLFMGQKGWVFNTTGAYRISAVYLGRVRSNELRINVVQPGSADDRAAADLILQNSEAQRFLYLEGGDHLASGKSALQQISTRYGNSALAGYANFALGASLSTDFANFQSGALRRADLAGANAILERSADRLPPVAFFSLGLLGQLNKNYVALNNTARANATKTQLQGFVNALPGGVRVFSEHLLLQRQLPGTLQFQTPTGFQKPRNLGP